MTDHRRLSLVLPVGLQSLVAMAAADPRFASALTTDRDAAVAASGLTLTPAEAAVLGAMPAAALRALVAGVGDTLPEPARRVFLQRAGQALLALGVISAFDGPADAAETPEVDRWLAGGSGGPPGTVTGSRPDSPGDRSPADAEIEIRKLECNPRDAQPLVRRILLSQRNALRYCYAKGLVLDPKLEGRVEYTFPISKEGRVLGVKISRDDLKVPSVVQCVRYRLASIRFPAAESVTSVVLELRFHRKRP